MAKAQSVEAAAGMERRMASLSVPLEGVGPGTLLRLGEGTARGFWAREGRWFAHVGEAARVEVADSEGGADRFQQVWAQARRLFSCSWKDPNSEVNPPSPRLFGGFSFRDDHQAEGAWAGFPSAHFILPEIELMGGEGRGVLTLRGFLQPGSNPAECRAGLQEKLREIRETLNGPGPQEEEGVPWIPATRAETDQAAWRTAVDQVLEEVTRGGLSKVVLARVQTVAVEAGLDPVDVALKLWEGNPRAHVFFYEPEAGHALMGAAPETVATVSGGTFRATAVAGSAPRGETDQAKKAFAKTLLKSKKDRREHGMCVEDMVERLTDLSEEVQAEEAPHVLTLSSIQHLETVIEAQLRPGETALSVLEALHPTPAVCGLPRDRALEFIRTEEPFQRGWYAGPVGWFDGDGNGVFVPALRSAVCEGQEWRLFAGAGIVPGSDSSQEWDETRIKFQPILRALSATRPQEIPDADEAGYYRGSGS